ncbi:MAG: hypothetical protein Q8P31_07730 [Bacillota bacterium]|nr:hypothetical protein [Bacillota bacterium]
MTSQDETNGREFAKQRDRYLQTMDALGAYGWTPMNLIPVGSGFKVESPRGPRFLKRFRFGPQEICLVHDMLEHLRSRGFDDAPRIYLTRSGEPYVHLDGEILYLQDWYDLSRPDIGEPGTLRTAVEIMARMHQAGERFRPRPGLGGLRDDYGSWLDKSVERLRDLYGFAELADEGRRDSRFDSRYAKAAPAFCRQAEAAVRRLADSTLGDLAQTEREAGAVCHRNFTPRNLAMDSRMRLRLLDFDSSGLEIRLEDLAKFVRRAAGLDLERAAFILQSYGQARGRPLSREETELIGTYLLFPMEFWAVGKSRYQKDHRRNRTLRRLLESAEQRARFAKIVGGLDLPAEPILVTLPGPGAVSGPEPVDTPDVPDGPHLPATPVEPDQLEAIPLDLLRMDAIDLPAGSFEEEAAPMLEETPIYQAWTEPEPEEEDVLVFAQPAPEETPVAPESEAPAAEAKETALEPGLQLVIPLSAEPETMAGPVQQAEPEPGLGAEHKPEPEPVAVTVPETVSAPKQAAVPASARASAPARRLVWGPLPHPVRPPGEQKAVTVTGEITEPAGDKETPPESPTGDEAGDIPDEWPPALDVKPARAADLEEAAGTPPQAEAPAPDDLEPHDAAPAEDQAVQVAAAPPGPRTIVWSKWPSPVHPRQES